MWRRIRRELYLLPRGEQRALIVLSFLLLASLGSRIGVQSLPGREPEGLEEFVAESRRILAAAALADSLERVRQDSVWRARQDSTWRTRQDSLARYARNKRYASNQHSAPSRISIPLHAIELNSADSAGLIPLPGIGPVFAGRIIRYRELLGGYHRTSQLSEVYGMKLETVKLIEPFLTLDTSLVRKIPVNEAAFRQLLRHPYLEYNDVKAIVNYRDAMGMITSLEEIREHALLADSIFERVQCYLRE